MTTFLKENMQIKCSLTWNQRHLYKLSERNTLGILKPDNSIEAEIVPIQRIMAAMADRIVADRKRLYVTAAF